MNISAKNDQTDKVTKQPLQVKIARLRASFINQLPARLEKIQQQVQLLVADGAANNALMPDLYRAFHGLNGTGKSFGLMSIAAIAERAEQFLLPYTEDSTLPCSQAWGDTLQDFVAQMFAEISSCYADMAGHDEHKHDAVVECRNSDVALFNNSAPLVYICDDEPEQVGYLAHQLSYLGYKVEHFTETSTFRAAVMRQRPDAVIMDVNFPHGRTAGTDELASIKEATGRELPAIVLSGGSSFESRLGAVRAGCAAYFVKPATAMDLAAALDELVEERAEEPYRILIVDDEPEVAQYHSLILEDAGMLVDQIHNPTQVFEALKTFSPDLMLVDMYMPVCNGAELAALVRQVPEYVGLPIVFLSSETDTQKQFSAMKARVEGFITKPVVPNELVASVTLRAERMRTLRGLMSRDSLTGLYNHTTTTEFLVSALGHAKRKQESLVMVMIDLDKFKNINDTYGHMAGDQVIVALSRMLKHRLRNTDIIGRYGGEEFALLLKDISDDVAAVLVNELREDFSNIQFTSGDRTFSSTFSAGISMYPGYEHSEDLRMAADTALYQAKELGRNQVVINRFAHD